MILTGWGLARLGAIFAAVALAITGLYLLRTQAQIIPVPFAALWQQTLRTSDAQRLWRRLRRPLSWLLQILVALLVLFALGAPAPDHGDPDADARTLVILLDASASMHADPSVGGDTDGPSRTRWARATQRARAELAGLGPRDRAAVIAVGAELRTLHTLGPADPAALDPARSANPPVPGEHHWTEALEIAATWIAAESNPEIWVFTDGALEAADAKAIEACAASPSPGVPAPSPACAVELVQDIASNTSIVGFAARRHPYERSAARASVTVQHDGPKPIEVTLAIEAEGAVVHRVPLTLAPGEAKQVTTPAVAQAERITAVLQAHQDGLALDDRAEAVVPPDEPQSVVLVTDRANLFVEAALLTLGDSVRLSAMAADAVEQHADDLATADLVVFDVGDRPLPDPLPDAPVLAFAPYGARSTDRFPLARGRALRRPFVTRQLRDHPLMAHVSFKDVNIAKATSFRLADGDLGLAYAFDEAVIALRHRDGPPRVAVGFDPRDTDWPLRVSFPVFITNVLRYLDESRAGSVNRAYAGEASAVSLAALGFAAEGHDALVVTAPSGTRRAVLHTGDTWVWRATEPGVYTVSNGDREVAIAALPTSPSGARLRSALPEDLAGLRTVPPAPLPRPLGTGQWWMFAVWVALAIVAAEWWTFHRRWTV